MRSHAERRFGDPALAETLLADTRRVATEQGALALVDRLATAAG